MKTLGQVIAPCLGFLLALSACERRESEFVDALPDRETIILDVPEDGQNRASLTAASGADRAALVGEPAEFWSHTYYAARDLNTLAGFILLILETVTDYPAAEVSDTSAVWGPFSDKAEPNEWRLNIEKREEGSLHYVWAIKGKHKSQGEGEYLAVAGGAFEPGKNDEQGKGWFVIDFEHIRALDPTEDGRGRIAYAYEKNDDGTIVLARFEGLDENQTPVSASYAYGENNEGSGFIVFQLPADIHDGEGGMALAEDVLIHTRFSPRGGRADVYAINGDLSSGQIVVGSQCWDGTFVSTHEQFKVDETVLATAGEASSCAFAEAATPKGDELPNADEVESPYTLDDVMQ